MSISLDIHTYKKVKNMTKTFTSWGALKSHLQKEMTAAMTETIHKSFDELNENVGHFYDAPEGAYHRTGQLSESPEYEISGGGDSITGQLKINTEHQYDPSGRDTQTIYGYAEAGELLGNGGFWERSKENIEKNIQEAFGKRFG